MVIAFLPCRRGSQRVPNKNTKAFSSDGRSLFEIKIKQLIDCASIDQVIVSTNDDLIKKLASTFLSTGKVRLDHRPDHLGSSSTSTDELIAYVPKMLGSTVPGDALLLWTHVTSPFYTESDYQSAITTYSDNKKENDSLMSVKTIHGFLWNEKSAINYDRDKEKWPRTQTIAPLYEIDSGIFLSSLDNYRKLNDRIGNTPFLFKSDGIKSFDIDYPDDFLIAQAIHQRLTS